MKQLLFSILLLLPLMSNAQEYGSGDKKILVTSFSTPFKNKVFSQFGQEMADAGYHVQIITPVEFVAPEDGTLVIYGEGALKGQPWSDTIRAYLTKNPNSIYFYTFKRGKLPPVAKGVDIISSASNAEVSDTVKDLIAKAKARF